MLGDTSPILDRPLLPCFLVCASCPISDLNAPTHVEHRDVLFEGIRHLTDAATSRCQRRKCHRVSRIHSTGIGRHCSACDRHWRLSKANGMAAPTTVQSVLCLHVDTKWPDRAEAVHFRNADSQVRRSCKYHGSEFVRVEIVFEGIKLHHTEAQHATQTLKAVRKRLCEGRQV